MAMSPIEAMARKRIQTNKTNAANAYKSNTSTSKSNYVSGSSSGWTSGGSKSSTSTNPVLNKKVTSVNTSPVKTTTVSTKLPNIVKTNTSYNGSFLDVDLNADYADLMNKAAARGDYNAAAQYNAQRNAKILYTGDKQNQVSYDYVSPYRVNNNQGGTVYTSNGSFNSLPSNWTTANVNGQYYKREGNNILQKGGNTNGRDDFYLVGQGINPNTGEFTFNDPNAARQVAYDRYLGTVGLKGVTNYNMNDAYGYLDRTGAVDNNYINAVMSGTTGQYRQQITQEIDRQREEARQAELAQQEALRRQQEEADRIRKQQEEYARQQEEALRLQQERYAKQQELLKQQELEKSKALQSLLQLEMNATDKVPSLTVDYYDDDEYKQLDSESQNLLVDNSFETDYRYGDYYDYMRRLENNNMRVW